MTELADDGLTPIDRPLMRSDLNEIREIVHRISERQLLMERGRWAPVVAGTALLALQVLTRLWP